MASVKITNTAAGNLRYRERVTVITKPPEEKASGVVNTLRTIVERGMLQFYQWVRRPATEKQQRFQYYFMNAARCLHYQFDCITNRLSLPPRKTNESANLDAARLHQLSIRRALASGPFFS
jgi:hypothetical protein